jgi:hypothetical protein
MRRSHISAVAVTGLALLAGVIIAPAGAQSPQPGALDFSGAPLADALVAGNAPGDPTYEMPKGQTLISAFGERPVFSPDGQKLAFIGHSYGDAFEYDLRTGKLRNLTSYMPHRGFLRVHYLKDGSFILLGPHEKAKTLEETRHTRIEMFWLDRDASRPAIPMRMTVFEGIATSPVDNSVAWTELVPRGVLMSQSKGTLLKTGKVVVENGTARLTDVKEHMTFTDCSTEAQDFLPGNKGITLPCYHIDEAAKGGMRTEILSYDFASREVTRYPTPPELYGEIEGIFPDGRHTIVECSGDRSAGMDLCVLELKPRSPRYTRITRIMDYGRWKYGNAVVSPDGRTIAAQVGPADVIDIGMGLGIVLISVPNGFPDGGS